MSKAYDTIGRTYASTRQPDPRIDAQIQDAIGEAASVLNVGAGTGSYEPKSEAARSVVALEPSLTMIRQRHISAASAVCGVSEVLPFADDSFDVVMALLTVHHWTDQPKGLAELRRVARKRVVIFTFDADLSADFWLIRDYLPSNAEIDQRIFPNIRFYAETFPDLSVHPVLVPADCQEGFLCAYWKRPEAYLEGRVQAGISSFAALPAEQVSQGLAALEADLESGRWSQRNSELADRSEMDYGYRLIIGQVE